MTTHHTHSPYLEDIPLAEALAKWWEVLAAAGLAAPLPGEIVPLDQAAGRHSIRWDASRLSSGVYFYQLVHNNSTMLVKKLMLVK